jgi:hypothetical protein
MVAGVLYVSKAETVGLLVTFCKNIVLDEYHTYKHKNKSFKWIYSIKPRCLPYSWVALTFRADFLYSNWAEWFYQTPVDSKQFQLLIHFDVFAAI